MTEPITALVSRLDLKPHPEGGFFRETFRSKETVRRDSGAHRAALTVIHYLLASGQQSRWHKVDSDEQWTFLEGEPLELLVASPDGKQITTTRLGPSSTGCDPVAVVPAGHWQAARPTGSHTLVSCTVGPGFDFADFQFLADNRGAMEAILPLLGSARALL